MLTATETADAVRAGRVSARDAVTECVDAIDRSDGKIGAILHVDRDGALRAAGDIDRRLAEGEDIGPIAGVPVAVKDNICTIDSPTTCASGTLKGYVSPFAADVAERLVSAGAVIVAKTNLDEFAMGSSTESSAYFPARNPWDMSRVAGGSSGGSAAAVAARIVPCALGSDTGGSIRQPAAFTGVVGLKPTYGRVSRYGLVAFGSSLDQIGPVTRDVRDAALLLSVIAGHDVRDATSVDRPVPNYVAELDRPIEGLRIGVASDYFGAGLDDAVRTAVEAGLDALRERGAELINVRLPHLKYAIACYYVVATAEASSNLARFDGVHYGHRTADPKDIFDLYSASRREGFGAEVKRRIMLGTFVLSSGYYDAYYDKALRVRTLIRGDFEAAFEKVDLIASPVTPTTAFPIGQKSADPLAMYLADIYTTSANLAGVPAISVPCGLDGDGLPIGMQLSAPWFEEDRLLAAAHQYQSITDHHQRCPKQ